MGPELLIPILAPLLTEAFKALWKLLFNELPPVVTPLISALAGGAMGGFAPMMNSSVLEGIELGLAGVGVHQTARLTGMTKRHRLSRATDRGKVAGLVLLMLLVLPACANTKAGTKAIAHGTIDSVCLVAHKGVDLAFGPIEDVQGNVTGAVSALTSP